MDNFQKKLIIIAVVFVLLVALVSSVVTTVPAGYTGVLTTYGKIENESMGSGMHFKLPWQKVIKLDNHIQTMRVSAGTKNPTTTDTAETKDQQLIPTFEFEIQYGQS